MDSRGLFFFCFLATGFRWKDFSVTTQPNQKDGIDQKT